MLIVLGQNHAGKICGFLSDRYILLDTFVHVNIDRGADIFS